MAGALPITLTEMKAFCYMQGMRSSEEINEFIYVMMELDREALDYLSTRKG